MNSSCKETCLSDYIEALFYDVIMNDNSELPKSFNRPRCWVVCGGLIGSFLVKHLMGLIF